MRSVKNIISKAVATVLVAAFALTCVPTASLPVKAELKMEVPSKVRIYPLSVRNSAIDIYLPDTDYDITGLKSNKGDLKVYKTYNRVYKSTSSDQESYKKYSDREVEIGCYARKEGKYVVSFNIVDGAKKVVKKCKVQVFAKSDGPFKSVKYAGRRLDFGEEHEKVIPNSGKFSVKMNKGYKLKKITLLTNTYKEDSNEYRQSIDTETSETDIKNNAKITLSDNAHKYKYKYDYDSTYYSNHTDNQTEYMCADTAVRITYIDRYTKQEATSTYYLYKLVNYNK